MRVCTFFGHRDCPEGIRPKLREALEELIRDKGVDLFYVGDRGRFDALVRETLRQLRKDDPRIRYAVVLASMPGRKTEYDDFSDTMLPEGIESVHPRYAIAWRNDWMLKRSDYVVTCVTHPWGGAARFAEKARKQGKKVHNLAPLR